jgi:hypothetical protein
MGAVIIHPCLPFVGVLASSRASSLRGHYPLHCYYWPLRHPLVFHRFPGDASYTVSCSADFSPGRVGLLQLLYVSLSSCCRYRPARVSRRISQFASVHTAFALRPRARPLGPGFSGSPVRSLSLRPNDSLTIPMMALLIDFIRFVSSTNAIQATEV